MFSLLRHQILRVAGMASLLWASRAKRATSAPLIVTISTAFPDPDEIAAEISRRTEETLSATRSRMKFKVLVDPIRYDATGAVAERLAGIICDDIGEIARVTRLNAFEYVHLFAAAPDLLAACKDALRSLAAAGDAVLVVQLRDAIAKSAGQSVCINP